jgi:hypothetical protein
MIYYINRQVNRYHETVDEFDSRSEAERMRAEYQFGEHGRAYYYVSRVARPNWSESN